MTTESFAGRTVLVTGAASGIGRTLAQAFAARGAGLLLADRDAEGLAQAQAAFANAGHAAESIVVDMRDPDAVAALADKTPGRIDALVNCAGVYPLSSALEMSVAEWDAVIETNLRGPFLATQVVARRMIADGVRGAIVNVSSTASVLARPGIAHYGASKAGLNQLTRVLAVELAPHGIRVNAVLPGVIATERVQAMAADPALQDEMAAKQQRIPAGRLGEPDEVVALILFLLSDAASYCTGGLYTVDGGFSLGIPSY